MIRFFVNERIVMPANHHIDTEAKLIITTWTGEAIDAEFIETIKKYQDNIQNQPEYIDYNEVVNLSEVTNIKLTTAGIRILAELASKTDESRFNGKLAFIVSSNLAFGLVRMYETYRSFKNNAGKKLRVFKREKDAIEWARSSA